MTPSTVARHRCIDSTTPLGEMRQKRRRQKRHVAAYHQYLLRGRFHQRRVETAERPRPWNEIRHDRYVHTWYARPIPGDDQDVRRQAAHQRQLPLEDRAGADDDRALVDPAKPPTQAAGKDGCCPGHVPIKGVCRRHYHRAVHVAADRAPVRDRASASLRPERVRARAATESVPTVH